MASLLVEAYKLDTKVDGPLETKFDDLKDSWGKDKANILVKLGISVGTGDKWEPNKSVTKAEALNLLLKLTSSSDKKKKLKLSLLKQSMLKKSKLNLALQ